MVTEQDLDSAYLSTFWIVAVFSLAVPMVLLIPLLAGINFVGASRDHFNAPLFYFFLTLCAILWKAIPLAAKRAVVSYRTADLAGLTSASAARNVVLLEYLVISIAYAAGFMYVTMTANLNRLAYFYAFGILYTVMFWPSKTRFTELVRKLEVS